MEEIDKPDIGLIAQAREAKLFIALGLLVAGVLGCSAYGVAVNGWQYDDWAPFAELVILAVGLLSLRLVHRQLTAQTIESRREFEWRKIQSFYEFFSEVPTDAINDRLHSLAGKHNIGHLFLGVARELTGAEVDAIRNSGEDELVVKLYLDSWEAFAGAVECGLVDDPFAFSMESGRVIRTYTIFKPYIDRLQATNRKAYLQLDFLANRWKKRRDEENENGRKVGTVQSGKLKR